MNYGARGSGRTTRALMKVMETVVGGEKPNLAFYVTTNSQMDDYCFRIIARLFKDHIQQHSMANRTILFKNGGRLRFVSFDDIYLEQYGNCRWRVKGYRPDTPILWDHHAEDTWTERQMARNDPKIDKRRVEMRKIMEKPPRE